MANRVKDLELVPTAPTQREAELAGLLQEPLLDMLLRQQEGSETALMPEEPINWNLVARAEALAQRFHEAYERLAPQYGYETREASRTAWADVPMKNKALMISVCYEILAAGLE